MTHSKIFSKAELTKNALRTVAERRFSDAMVLLDTRKNAHANGAMYLAGFVIECLLKAQLLVEYPWLANTNFENFRNDKVKSRIWLLCYRSHALDEIFAHLPKLQRNLDAHAQSRGATPTQLIKEVCSWTIFARYSPHQETSSNAQVFVRKVKDLKGYFHA